MNSERESAHSGDFLAVLAGTSDPRTGTLTQVVTDPAGCHLTLSYWLHVDTAETASDISYDDLKVWANGKLERQITNLSAKPGNHLDDFRRVRIRRAGGHDLPSSFPRMLACKPLSPLTTSSSL
jgi:hypothetical protein